METKRRKAAIEQVEIPQRHLTALELRKMGLSYRKIAEKLGVSHVQIYNDIKSELASLSDLNTGATEELRQLELERLDRIIAALDHWVQSGNTQAAIALLKAMDTRAKLLGLYKPTEIKIDIQVLLKLQIAADRAGVDLSEVFEALINRFANAAISS